MKNILVLAVAAFLAVGTGIAQRRPPESIMREPLVREPVRGTHAAVAAGSGYATGAGMRMLLTGGNAVDAGVASIFAAATT